MSNKEFEQILLDFQTNLVDYFPDQDLEIVFFREQVWSISMQYHGKRWFYIPKPEYTDVPEYWVIEPIANRKDLLRSMSSEEKECFCRKTAEYEINNSTS